jgi:hypothetical protein
MAEIRRKLVIVGDGAYVCNSLFPEKTMYLISISDNTDAAKLVS